MTVAVIGCSIYGVMFSHFSDEADKPFWWKFFSISGPIVLVALVIGWGYLWNKDNPKNRR